MGSVEGFKGHKWGLVSCGGGGEWVVTGGVGGKGEVDGGFGLQRGECRVNSSGGIGREC